ncbi:MAG: LamG domain-containing protein, partial [Nitrospirae bacterium]|nr:LamG domain-containing protein [Nitrospirota bacterium]
MKFIKQNPGLLRSARSWGALGLLLALVVTFGSWQATSIPSTFIVEGTVTYSAQPQPPTPCATPPSGMVAWYTLDEQSGAGVVYDVADWDDNGNTLDANGSTTTISATAGPPPAGPVPVTSLPLSLPSGKVGSALYFYGPYVQVPLPAADLNFAKGDLSIDAWVWPVQVGPGRIQPIVDRLDLSQNKGYAFYVEDGLLRFRMGDGTFAGSASTGSVTYGTWNHVAVTVNRSDPLSGVKFYINGALVGFGPTVTGIIDNAQAVWIGKSRLSPPAGFGEIAIDELEVFNRVLTPTEINDIFQADKAGKCKSDLGDAPDSTNHAAAQMATGYGPTANFPTVYDPGAPHGPIHLNATGDAWLGKAVTLEGEADQGWDQDPTNNILPGPNIANKDGADDGVSPLPILPFYCSTQPLTYSVTVIGPTKPRYVSVWFDFKQDGDWDDVIQCPGTPLSAREWAVQNHLINLGPGFHPGLVTPSFVAFLDPNKSISTWMRVTLTDVPVAPAQADGSGPPGGYPFGETEDYFLGKDPSGSAEICVFKFEDKNGNGMWDINFSNPNDPNNEPLLSGWTFNVNPGPPNQVTTDPTGNICFSVPAPGTYTITEVPLPGWVPTSLNPQTQTVFSTT